MSNTLKLLCLAMLPSLSFAADQTINQTPSIYLSGYQLTQKVLEAYFKAKQSAVSSSQNAGWTEYGSKITVFEPKPKDSTVDFKFKSLALSDDEDPLTLAIVKMLKSKGSTGYDIRKEYALDNGIACQYKWYKYDPTKKYTGYKNRSERYVSCHGSISRELFDAIKKNAEMFEAMKQQEDKASE